MTEQILARRPAPAAVFHLQVEKPAVTEDDQMLTPAALKLLEYERQLGNRIDLVTRPSMLAQRVERLYHERRNRRMVLDNEMTEAYRRYNGEYSGHVKALLDRLPNRSRLWVHLTRMKCDASHADIMDVLRGPGSDRPWTLEPRHIPDDTEVPEEVRRTIAERFGQPDVPQEIIVELLRADLDFRTRNMADEIDNQFEASDYDEILDQMSLEMVIAGTGCIKGPFTVRDTRRRWGGTWDANLEFAPKEEPTGDYRPQWKWVPIRHVYPDMECSNVQDGSVIEEVILSRREMMELALQPGVHAAAVLKVLKENPEGNYTPTPYDIEMRQMSGDSRPSDSKLYRYFCYAGDVLGRELREAGVPVADESLDVSVRAMIYACGKHLLYAQPLSGPIPYMLIPYRKRAAGGPFGVGLPILIKGSQDAINGAARFLMDNAAIASGPIVEVNMKLFSEMEPGSNPADIHGWKVYTTWHDGHSGKRAVNVMSLPAYSDMFIMIIDLFRRLMDEESGLSSITGGMQGVGTTKTATGMSILNTNASKTRNRTLGYIDDRGLEPMVEGAIWWNHKYNSKPNILGPMKAVARGAHSVLAREVESQRILTALQIAMSHPVLGQNVEFLLGMFRRLMRSLGLPTEDLPRDEAVKMAMETFGEAEELQNGMRNQIPGFGAERANRANQANQPPAAPARTPEPASEGAPQSGMFTPERGQQNIVGMN